MPPTKNNAEQIWKAFSYNHAMKLHVEEQPLLSNKVHIFQALEKHEELLIFYRYKFFSLDPDGFGDDFRLILPCNHFLHISRLPFFKRIFRKEKMEVQSNASESFNQELMAILYPFYSKYPGLVIRAREPDIELPWSNQQQLLEIRTARLPERIEELEQFRFLAIKLHQKLANLTAETMHKKRPEA